MASPGRLSLLAEVMDDVAWVDVRAGHDITPKSESDDSAVKSDGRAV
jgi:hypothetical protein